MKKVLFLLFAAVLMVACSESYEDRREEAIDLVKTATSKVKAATTMRELVDIVKEMKDAGDEIEFTTEEMKKLKKDFAYMQAMNQLQIAAENAGERCAINCINNGEDPTPYLIELAQILE